MFEQIAGAVGPNIHTPLVVRAPWLAHALEFGVCVCVCVFFFPSGFTV